jgi:hypothetical protein
MISFAVLTLAVWWIRKFGAATAVGLIATVINFGFTPSRFHFLGFTADRILRHNSKTYRILHVLQKLVTRYSFDAPRLSAFSRSGCLIIGTLFMACQP